MKCYVCDQDNWQGLPELKTEKLLQVCKNCGNAALHVEPQDEEKVKEYYRREYRPEPTYENVLTTNRKLNYVRLFLKDYLKGKENLLCGDVGCATGYIVNWFKSLGHRSTGSELTLTYRRTTEHFYGIPIPEDLEPKHRYDLISMYHVFEHLTEPDKKLKHYVDLLADDGRIFIATPEWLDVLEESSGTPMSSFSHLFPGPHINVFTKQSIQNLFAKVGLVIEKEDHVQYGQAYLLKKRGVSYGEFLPPLPIVKEDPEEVIGKLKRTDEAIKLFQQKRWKEAIDVWPKFPEAWIKLIYDKYGKDPESQNKLFDEAHVAVGDNARLARAHAEWFYQNQHFDKAYEQLNWLVGVRPNEDVFWYIGLCLVQLGHPKQAMAAFDTCHQMNPMRWADCMNAMLQAAARMPTWDERLMAEAVRKLAAGLPRPEFNDPALEIK